MQNSNTDAEYLILENIYAASGGASLHQREIAQLARTSLGMTNSILKRLAQKGWLSIKKINSRNIRYAVTIDGMNAIIQRSYGYFKRTIRNVAFYRNAIDDALQNAAKNGINTVYLAGNSDLDFIVEHICRHSGLAFLQMPAADAVQGSTGGHILTVFAESIPLADSAPAGNSLYLAQLVIKSPANA